LINENIWYGYAFAENLENMGKRDQAEQFYRQLLQIFPHQFAIWLRLIRLLKSAGEFESALVIALRLEKRNSDEKMSTSSSPRYTSN